MTRILVLALIGLLAFFAAAIALTPARVFHDLVLLPRGVYAAHVSGPIWNGRWRDVRQGRVRLAQVDAALQAGSLLAGRPALRVRISDPRGRGEAIVVLNGEALELREASGRIAPAGLVGLAGPARAALAEPVMLSNVEGRFGPRGCETLSGAVVFGGLAAIDTRGAGSLPVLEGVLECAGSQPAVRFAGETPDVSLNGHARLSPAGADWSLNAQPRTGAAALALRAIGFTGDGDALSAQGQTSWAEPGRAGE